MRKLGMGTLVLALVAIASITGCGSGDMQAADGGAMMGDSMKSNDKMMGDDKMKSDNMMEGDKMMADDKK